MIESFKKTIREVQKLQSDFIVFKKPLESEIDHLHILVFAGIVNQADFELHLLDLKSKELWTNKFKTLDAALKS